MSDGCAACLSVRPRRLSNASIRAEWVCETTPLPWLPWSTGTSLQHSASSTQYYIDIVRVHHFMSSKTVMRSYCTHVLLLLVHANRKQLTEKTVGSMQAERVICLFVFISGTMRFSRYGLKACATNPSSSASVHEPLEQCNRRRPRQVKRFHSSDSSDSLVWFIFRILTCRRVFVPPLRAPPSHSLSASLLCQSAWPQHLN